jgi:putative ABC transport system permease protein
MRDLLTRSLSYYWRTNLAVAAGVAAATAVIVGAMLVGDSVRDSLRQMSLDRLGGVDAAWVGRRFVREALPVELGQTLRTGEACTPAIVLPASLTRSAGQGVTRAGGVTVYGVGAPLWTLLGEEAPSAPTGNEVVLNRRTASQLGVAAGDEVSLIIEIPPSIPRDSLLGDRDETVTELTLQVKSIAPDAATTGRFGLNPSQQLPLNAYVSLETLQQQLGLSEVLASKRNPDAKPARVNAMFLGGGADSLDPEEAETLTDELARLSQLADLGLKLTPYESAGYFALESDQLILENALADAGAATAKELQARTSPVLVYLLNRLGTRPADGDTAARGYSMYSVAAGIDFATDPPFGPFEFVTGGPPTGEAAGSDTPVVLNDWLAADLASTGRESLPVGATFPVRYHVVGDRGELPEDELTFRVSGVVKLAGVAAERGFTPQVAGVTDVESYSDWREPFPLDHDAITDRDDEFWKLHRATPKVFLRLEDAQRLWQSRYGKLTSLRIAPPAGMTLDAAMQEFAQRLLARLTPDETGLIVQAVKAQGLQAASGTTDFTGLFAGFSLFLIAAAMLLIGLLFRLGVDRRVRELGLLAAVGFEPRRVRRLMFGEGLAVAGGGVLIGIPAGIAYAGLMICGLKTWWNRAIGTEFLFLSVRPMALIGGAVAGLLVAMLAIGWALRQARRISSRDLLHGATQPEESATATANRGRRAAKVALTSLAITGVLLIVAMTGALPGSEAFGGLSWPVVVFFLMGTAALVGCLSLLAAWLASDRAAAVQGAGTAALARLGLRNAARNRGRSLLTACLIASAAFLIVAVACGQRNPQSEAPQRDSGNGGFLLVAQSSQPVLYDLNTAEGRRQLRFAATSPAEQSLLDGLYVAPFRMRAGEDASCLNLYQTQLPTILGMPHDVLEKFDREGRFRFANTPGEHRWMRLEEPLAGGRIPVLGDVNTLMFSLKLGLGGTLAVPEAALADSETRSADLEVAGMLDGSIFQGVLLMSEANFQRLFPSQAGFRYFLIESPGDVAALTEMLESQLSDSGFDAEPVAARLADFLAVQNTYLSTFQTLGGLGLLLGTVGLATVMLRNVLERRSELALLRAVGLQPASVLQLVWWENFFLLAAGLAAGTASALLAMQPHLSSSGAAPPWLSLAGLLGAVLVVGLLAPLFAAREVVRTPILRSLRSE